MTTKREKTSAQGKAQRAIRRGDLVRQPCVVCGHEKVLAHHPDYDKPLDVVWLCPKHHIWHHRYGISIKAAA